jgi:hypothetical protein
VWNWAFADFGAPKPPYSFGFGGGSSRAWHNDSNPVTPWWPSQNGLLSLFPHRHNEIMVRPASPY